MISAAKKAATYALKASKKFEKELERFFVWAQKEGYTVNSKVDGQIIQWSKDIIIGFEEPPRNKLDAFLKNVMSQYNICDERGLSIEDNKVLVKMFRKAEKETDIPEYSPTLEKKCEPTGGNKKKLIVIDNTIDSSKHFNIDTLPHSTQQLINAFGKPMKTGTRDTKHEYEWKVRIGKNEYSIYNWVHSDGTFDDFDNNEWYIGGTKEVNIDMKQLFDYIENENNEMFKNKFTTYEGCDRCTDDSSTKSDLDYEDIIDVSEDEEKDTV